MAFINLSRILDVNPEERERMGQRALEDAQPAWNKARMALDNAARDQETEWDSGAIAQADAKRAALRSMAGLQATVGSKQGGAGGLLDAAFARSSKAMGNMYSQMAQTQNYANQYQSALRAGDGMTQQKAALRALGDEKAQREYQQLLQARQQQQVAADEETEQRERQRQTRGKQDWRR